MADRNGLVGSLIAGVGGLIIVAVVVLLIISTMLTSNLLGSATTQVVRVNWENSSWINYTNPYQLGTAAQDGNSSRSSFTIIVAYNWTRPVSADAGLNYTVIETANYTLTPTTGKVQNATTGTWPNVSFTYEYTYTSPDAGIYQDTAQQMQNNLTDGIDNISTKIPTILLIAAVVLLFGVIVLLVKQSQAMGFGQSGGSL